MALSNLFTRRPAISALPAEAPEPKVWPEIGETWNPEGVSVVQRYYNQAHAVVLVYTACARYRCVVACLGCHFTKAHSAARSYDWMELSEAAEAANEHATTCRALPRDLPTRPGDATVHKLLHKRAREYQDGAKDNEFRIDALDLARLTIQRTNVWIEAALRKLADEQPDLLLLRTSHEGGAPRFFVRHYTPVS
ncbi:hypothetical protein [Streptomyces sp. NPDC014623]|uniref:hypothetical protein n=1 Tax=Streptomyces sp. NPDC014623 TaxID=3364875 RepID=UPI0036FD4730